MRIAKDGRAIESLEDWGARAGPKSTVQWAVGRSAMEAARAWLAGGVEGMPPEVHAALALAPDFGPPQDWHAEPEVKLPFDKFRGEPRNSDLVVWAQDNRGRYVIAVEAKADEPFDDTLADVLQDGLERRISNPESRRFTRAEQLALSLLPARAVGTPAATELRYQLLTACAGAIAEAERRDCGRAVMLVHEFITPKTMDMKHASNARDLDAFLHRLSFGSEATLSPGRLYGRYFVPGAPLFSKGVALYVGKVQRNLR